MALPTPVLSDGDIVEPQGTSFGSAWLIWSTWGQDPIKTAVIQAILSCQPSLPYRREFLKVISMALGQNRVCSLHYSSLGVQEVHDLNAFRMLLKLRIFSFS